MAQLIEQRSTKDHLKFAIYVGQRWWPGVGRNPGLPVFSSSPSDRSSTTWHFACRGCVVDGPQAPENSSYWAVHLDTAATAFTLRDVLSDQFAVHGWTAATPTSFHRADEHSEGTRTSASSAQLVNRPLTSRSTVDIPPVADVQNLDGPVAVIDGVPDSVLPAPSPPVAFKGLTQRCSHAMGVLDQWPIKELHACRGDGLRQLLGELACRSTGHLYPVGHSGWVRAR